MQHHIIVEFDHLTILKIKILKTNNIKLLNKLSFIDLYEVQIDNNLKMNMLYLINI